MMRKVHSGELTCYSGATNKPGNYLKFVQINCLENVTACRYPKQTDGDSTYADECTSAEEV